MRRVQNGAFLAPVTDGAEGVRTAARSLTLEPTIDSVPFVCSAFGGHEGCDRRRAMIDYYAQILAIGLAGTLFHCGPMCGPLIAGLTAAPRDASLPAFQRMRRRAVRVLSYQLGRAVTYMTLGITAGVAGAAIDASVQAVTRPATLLCAAAIGLAGIIKLAGGRAMPEVAAKLGGHVGAAMGFLPRAVHGAHLRLFVVGIVLGLLPCGLALWALGIAAATADPLHGAGVMLMLLLLTTPTLIGAACAAGGRRTWSSRHMAGALMLASAGWLVWTAMQSTPAACH